MVSFFLVSRLTIVSLDYFAHCVSPVGHQQDIYGVSYKSIVHNFYIVATCCVCLCLYSRFTLIVDNTDPLLESRDFTDQQMVSDIIGRHTSMYHQCKETDTLISSSDFEQVRTVCVCESKVILTSQVH